MAVDREEILEQHLEKKEELQEALRDAKYKLKEFDTDLEEVGAEVKDMFKTTDPKKLKVIAQRLDKELDSLLQELEENETYLEIMEQ